MQVEGAALDKANDIYLLANFHGGAPQPYLVFKYSTSGNLAWTAFPNRNAISVSTGLSIDGDTNVLVTGKAGYYPDSFYGSYKISPSGSILWTNDYPQSPVGLSVATSIAVDSANNSYVTGYSPGTNSSNDIVTIKYDPNGNQIWLQRYNGPGSGNDAGNAIAVDNNGNVYVTGYETTAAGGTEIVTIKYSPVTLQRRADGTVLLQAQGSARRELRHPSQRRPAIVAGPGQRHGRHQRPDAIRRHQRPQLPRPLLLHQPAIERLKGSIHGVGQLEFG